jgi:peptidoglycan/LPS O-acetylase OafA/YrhL
MRIPTLKQYFGHRALRIFPALWVCLVVSFLFAAWQGDLETRSLFLKTVVWAGLQGSFFQFVNFYVNPGVTNGVLWSIATELQFYVALPIMALLGSRFVHGRVQTSVAIVALAVVSAAIQQWTLDHQTELLPRLFPTLYASLLANGYLFAFGVLAYQWQDKMLPLCRNRLLQFLTLYVVIRGILSISGISPTQVHASTWGLVVYAALGLLVYSFAFSFQHLSNRLLKSNDLSYGIYIYHMPVIYASLHMEIAGFPGLALVACGVALLATASWFLVERPALRFKGNLRLSANTPCWTGNRQ